MMQEQRVLRIVFNLRSEDCPCALAAASQAWALTFPSVAAPHYLQVRAPGGHKPALIPQPVEDLDRLFSGGFAATWAPGLGWLVELNPDEESEPLAGTS